MQREARVLLLIYTAVALSLFYSSFLLWIWIVPVLISQPVLRAYLLAEHGLCPPVADMFANTRTTFTNRLVRALAWNMPYHAEHHAFRHLLTGISFFCLSRLHLWIHERTNRECARTCA